MIKTLQYNDFTGFVGQIKEEDFLAELKKFKESGGDLSLPVKIYSSNYDLDSYKLVSLEDFVKIRFPEPLVIINRLGQEGYIDNLFDFSYDSKTKSITESKSYNLRWMSQNYNKSTNIINKSLEKLITSLPNNFKEIEKFYVYNNNEKQLRIDTKSEDNIENFPKSYRIYDMHPLIFITNEINTPYVHELILNKYPQLKEYWNEKSKFSRDEKEEFNFLKPMGLFFDNIKKPEIAVCFFKLGIGREYFYAEENSGKLYEVIKHAIYSNDINFLKEVLPNVNLIELEKDKHHYDLFLSYANTKETVQLLLENKATIQDYNLNRSVNLITNGEIKNTEVLDTILSFNPATTKKIINENTDELYKSLNKNSFENVKLFVEKYHFPLENYDMLSLGKNHKIHNDTNDYYEWAIKSGADVRRCDKFCEYIVEKREEGLKILRNLNKKGLIVSKSPDFIFNIFQQSPTKNFINYYDKCTFKELESYTIDGNPAWWGAKNSIDLNWMLKRIENKEQSSKNNKPYYFYLLEKELTTNKMHISTMLETMLYYYNKNPDFKFNFDYEDENGNNMLHLLFKTKKYIKNNLNKDVINLLSVNNKDSIYKNIMKENKDGITAFEVLINSESNYAFVKNSVLKDLIFNNSEYIDYNKTIKDGRKVSETLYEYFKEYKETLTKLQSIILEKELTIKDENNSTEKNNRIKI